MIGTDHCASSVCRNDGRARTKKQFPGSGQRQRRAAVEGLELRRDLIEGLERELDPRAARMKDERRYSFIFGTQGKGCPDSRVVDGTRPPSPSGYEQALESVLPNDPYWRAKPEIRQYGVDLCQSPPDARDMVVAKSSIG